MAFALPSYRMTDGFGARPKFGTPMIGAFTPTAMWFTGTDKTILRDYSPNGAHALGVASTMVNVTRKGGAMGRFGGGIPTLDLDPSAGGQWNVSSLRQSLFDNLVLGGNGKYLTLWLWYWPDPNAAAGDGPLMNKSDGNTTGAGWWFEIHTGLPLVKIEYTTTNRAAQSTVGLTRGVWYHLCLTHDPSSGTGTTHLYVNGSDVTSLTAAGTGSRLDDSARLLNVMSSANGGTQAAPPVGGAIDHIGLDAKRAYSPQEVQDLYQHPFRMFSRRTYTIVGGLAAATIGPSSFLFAA